MADGGVAGESIEWEYESHGLLKSGAPSEYTIDDDDGLKAFMRTIRTSRPVYAEGRMAVERWEEVDDDFKNGSSQEGVDWDVDTLLISSGTINSVIRKEDGSGIQVNYRREPYSSADSYHAVWLVGVKGETIEFVNEAGEDAGPGFAVQQVVMQEAVSFEPLEEAP